MDIMTFITENFIILVPVLYVIGRILKGIPKAPDWCIPFGLLAIGEARAFWLMGLTADAAIQGVLVTGAAVLVNQGIKQGKEAFGKEANE